MRRFALSLLVGLVGAHGACLSSGTKGDPLDVPGKKVALAVAPLTLPAIQDVCYDIVVENGASPPDVVFAVGDPSNSSRDGSVDATAICATQYGDSGGGDISYTGPCDAATTVDSGNGTCLDQNRDGDCDDAVDTKTVGATPMDVGSCVDLGDGGGGAADGDCDDTTGTPPLDIKVPQGYNEVNSVTIFLDGVKANGHWLTDQTDSGDTEFQNPCPESGGGGGGCRLSFTCQENEDVPVTFNLVVLRDANQGFFDATVTFEDIFCSAKFDTVYDSGPIQLLYVNGQRVRTGVLAYACTGGTNDTATSLYAQRVKIACANGEGADHVDYLDIAAAEEGYQHPPPGSAVTEWNVTRGQEQLDCGSGAGSCKKVFATLAFAIETDTDCTISTRLTAAGTDTNSDGSVMVWSATAGTNTPGGVVYPFMQLDNVAIKGGAGWLDVQGPMGSTTMTLEYTKATEPQHFCSRIDVDAVPHSQSDACTVP